MAVFELEAVLGLDTSQFEKGTKGALATAQKLGNGIKSGLSAAVKIAGAAIAATSAAAVALGKQALDLYSDYEQLVGGVETLFKGASGTVLNFAQNAYKTAGMSANEYMETVTSFSASLIQSLGGDTDKAASYADMAITDMSDNANKMGTDISALQSAYSGFAKQNYTMLDNLKLGYGGTKSEMDRLIKDAMKLDKNFKVAEKTTGKGKKANKELAYSYADIVQAIHIVQDNMGITGTTAKEAGSTIQGSLKAAKSAWQNLLTGLGDENADLGQLVDNFVDSAMTAAENIVPRLGQIFSKVGEALPMVVNEILPQVLQFVTDNMPILIEAGIQILTALITGLISAIPQLIEALPRIWEAIKTAFSENAPAMAEAGQNLLNMLITGIGNLLAKAKELISEKLAEWHEAATEKVTEFKNAIHDGFTALVTEVGTWVQENIITPLKDGIAGAVDIGRQVVEKIKEGINSAWSGLTSWFNNLWNGLFGNRNVNVNVTKTGGFAIGLDYVPTNGFPAILHKGEAVLTAREADQWRRGRNGGTTNVINQYIQSVPQTPVQLASATAAYFEQARWAI